MVFRRKITPPAALAAAITIAAASAGGDGRVDIDTSSFLLPDPVDLAAYGLEVGVTYVVNADGTLTPR